MRSYLLWVGTLLTMEGSGRSGVLVGESGGAPRRMETSVQDHLAEVGYSGHYSVGPV